MAGEGKGRSCSSKTSPTSVWKKKEIRIVVVGDAGTGKSSLVASAAEDVFPVNVPPVLPPTRLPPNFYPENIPITIIDTSSRKENKLRLVEDLKRADAVVLTYACDEAATSNSLITFWLPELRRLGVNAPITVVGCKADLVDEDERRLEQLLTPIMVKFREIEACLECSAIEQVHVEHVFYLAQKAVLYPTSPVYDRETQTLMPRCQRALKRIFILCDHDMDGAFSDAELNKFQLVCFDAPLHPAEISAVKGVVRDSEPEGINELGLTLRGFLFLHVHFVDKGRIETIWTVLRTFGYNDNLALREEFLPVEFKRAPDQSVELTTEAVEFLKRVFSVYDADNDGVLGISEFDELFSTAPASPWSEAPYHDAVDKSGSNGLSLKGYLSEWALMTLLDPAYSLAHMIYIGYPGDLSSAFRITRKRSLNLRKQETDRNVFQCFVFGPKNAGKSALLDSFVSRAFSEKCSAKTRDRYAANAVDTEGVEKMLVLREISEEDFKVFLSSSKHSLASCDVAVFVYDCSNENSWIRAVKMVRDVAIQGEVSKLAVPCVLVAAKTDLHFYPTGMQDSMKVCGDMVIELPIAVSSKHKDMNGIFSKIIRAAQRPHLGIPETDLSRRRKHFHRLVDHSLILLAVGAAIGVVAMAAYRSFAARKNVSD